MAWIEIIDEKDASGELKEVYDKTRKNRGALASIHKIHSLNPKSLTAHMELYMTLMYGQSPLSRRERELIGVVVSLKNKCSYCVEHHLDAFSHYEKDVSKINALRLGNFEVFDNKDLSLCAFASKLTENPSASSKEDVEKLKNVGYSDRAILDISQITSYFNFVNRIVLSLGVSMEDIKQEFKY